MTSLEQLRDQRFLEAYEKADDAGVKLPEMTGLSFDAYRDLVEPILEEHGFLCRMPTLRFFED
jgi:hypothetical protein